MKERVPSFLWDIAVDMATLFVLCWLGDPRPYFLIILCWLTVAILVGA